MNKISIPPEVLANAKVVSALLGKIDSAQLVSMLDLARVIAAFLVSLPPNLFAELEKARQALDAEQAKLKAATELQRAMLLEHEDKEKQCRMDHDKQMGVFRKEIAEAEQRLAAVNTAIHSLKSRVGKA